MKRKNTNEVWVKNFSGINCGYPLIMPFVNGGVDYMHNVLLKEFRPHITEIVLYCKGVNINGGYFRKSEIDLFIKRLITEVLNDPDKIKDLHKETFHWNKIHFDFAEKVISMNLKKCTDRELGLLFSKLMHIQMKMHMHSLSTTWFIDSEDTLLSKFLISMTKEIVEKRNVSIDPAKAFSILTTHPDNSFTLQEEIESLQIFKKIKNDKKSSSLLLNLKDFSKIPDDFSEKLKDEIYSHYKKWRWLPFQYLGPAYDIDNYLLVWKDLLSKNFSVDEKLDELINRPKRVLHERNLVVEKLKLSEYILKIYDTAAEIVFLKGFRKEVFFHGSYALSFIVSEVARRKGYSRNQVYMLTNLEIEDILLYGKEISISEINKRMFPTIFHYLNGKLYMYTGNKAKKFFSALNIQKLDISKNVSELNGVCACSGMAEGTVKIINSPSDMVKMNEGNIMVSHTTFPSLVPAMKKASAIITEDGGITCHAAIVSRELNTPCITGVKNALDFLKDGDKVKVNASEGIVKILK
ncbi:MAG: PEP-utilizing enzyme [Candidatus Woesearchaeota archaeon]